MGDDCTIYHGMTLGGTNWREGKRHPTLGDHVVVGAGAKILGPITVGHHAWVGSNAVVVKDVSDGTTVVGIPARPINRNGAGQDTFQGEQGFSPYGQPSNVPDPVTQVLQDALHRFATVDSRVETLAQAIQAAAGPPGKRMPAIRCNDAGISVREKTVAGVRD